MADNIEVGRVDIPIYADTRPFDREIQNDLKTRAGRAARQVGQRMGGDIVDGLKQQYRTRIADAKESLARGLIDRRQFEQQGRQAAEAFNRGILNEIRRLGNEGKLTNQRFIELSETLKKTGAEGAQVGRGTRLSLESLQGWIRGTFAVAFLAIFANMTGRAARMVADLARNARDVLELGGQRTRIRESFENIAGNRELDPVAVYNELRRATRGLVDDTTLWRQANKAMQADLPLTAELMGEAATLSRRMAESVGRDATDAFNRFIDGVAKGEQGILEEIGILTTLEKAVQAHARANDRSADSYSKAEQTAIFFNAVLEEMRTKVGRLGDDTLDAGERGQQLSVAWTNIKSAMAEAIAQMPAVVTFLDDMGTRAEGSAGRVQDLANRIAALGNTLVAMGDRAADHPLLDVLGFGVRAMTGNWRSQAGAAGQLTGFNAEFAHQLRLEEIRDSETFLDILTRQVETQRELNEAISAAGRLRSEDEQRRIEFLRDELDAIKERRRELQPGLDELDFFGGGRSLFTPDEPVSPEEQRRQEQLARQRAQMQERIADAFYALTHDAVEVELRALDQLEDELREVGGLTDEWAAKIDALRDAASQQGAFGEMQRMLQALPAEGEKRAAGLNILREQAQALLDTLVEGSPAWRQMLAFLEQIDDASRDTALALKKLEPDPKSTAAFQAAAAAAAKRREEEERAVDAAQEHARAIEQGARGALQIAEAVGLIGGEAAQALQGVAQLASSLVEIQALMSSGMSIGLGPILGAVGAVASIISAVRGNQEMNERMAQETIESQADLIRALDELTGAVLSDMTAAEREQVLARTEGLGVAGKQYVEDLTAAQLDAVRRLEEATGINILREAPSGRTFVDDDQLELARKLFAEMDLSGFGEDLSGRLDALDFKFDLLGDAAGDAGDRLDELIQILLTTKGAQGLGRELQRILAEQGADAALAFVDELVRRFAAGDETLFAQGGLFSGLTREEALRLLEEMRGLLAGGGGVIGGGSNVQRLAVSLTEAQGNQLVSLASTQVHHLAAIRAALEGRPVSAISAAGVPMPAVGAGTVVHLNVGGIQVSVAGGEGLTPSAARAAGGAMADEFNERVRRAWRGAGRLGSPSLPA